MFYKLISLALLICSTTLLADVTEAKAQDNENEEVTLIAVRMYADWCGNCKQLDAKIDEIKSDFADTGILFLYYDQTDDYTSSQATKKAQVLGMSDIFSEYKGRTGMLLLVNPKTGELIEELSHRTSRSRLQEKLKEYS